MKRVYIIIVNWNGWRDTVECLESVMRLEGSYFRVVVCDNASSDDSLKHISDWAGGSLNAYVPDGNPLRQYSYPPVKKPLDWMEYDRQEAESGGKKDFDPPLVFVRTGGNLGFAGGNNVGLRYALARDDFDFVWLLNNDTVVEPLTLASLLSRMSAKPTAGMCGSTLLRYHEPQRIDACGGGYYCKWIGLPWHIGRTRKADKVPDPGDAERWMNYVVGASLLVSRQFLKDIGLMCEEYFLFFEETDWAIRSKGRYSLAYSPESVVYHKIGASIGTRTDPREKSLLCDYYNISNRIYFTRKYYPYALVTIYTALLFAIVVRLICGQWKRAVMIARMMAVGGKGCAQQS